MKEEEKKRKRKKEIGKEEALTVVKKDCTPRPGNNSGAEFPQHFAPPTPCTRAPKSRRQGLCGVCAFHFQLVAAIHRQKSLLFKSIESSQKTSQNPLKDNSKDTSQKTHHKIHRRSITESNHERHRLTANPFKTRRQRRPACSTLK